MSAELAKRAGSGVAWRAIQLAGGKLIFLARTLILARLLVPEDFGLFAVSLIAVDFLTNASNLGMIPALIQRRDAEERHYDVAWTVSVVRGLTIMVSLFLAAPLIAQLVGEPRATDLIRVVALRPALEAAASIKVAELTRELRFRSLAWMSLPEALVNTVTSIALAPVLGVWALVAGLLAGMLAYVVMSYLLAPHRPSLKFEVATAWPLVHFGRWIFLIGLISLAGRSALQVLISHQLGTAALGLYFLAAKLAFIPAEISGELVGAVAFPFYARLQADIERVGQAFRAMFLGLSSLIFPVCALIIALAPAVVERVLGPRWEGTAPLIQLLALVNVIGLLGDTVTPILKGLGQPNRLALIEAVQSTLLVILIWALVDKNGVISAGLAWLAAVGLSQALSAVFVRRVLPRPLAGLAKPVIAVTAISALGGLLASGTVRVVSGLPGLALAALLSLVTMGLLLWAADRGLGFGLAQAFQRAFPQLARGLRRAPTDSVPAEIP